MKLSLVKRLLYIWDIIALKSNWRYEFEWSTPSRPEWSGWYMHSTVMETLTRGNGTGRVQYQRQNKPPRLKVTVEYL